MKTNTPYIFELSIKESQVNNIIDLLENKNIDKFSFPLTGDQFKIYVLTEKNNIIYVGTTKSSIKNRLRYGLKMNGKNGYHGYKWKHLSTVRLLVWCFDDFDKEKIEFIEAELVYLIRTSTGKWPTHQNEIHFNNLFIPKWQQIVEELYSQITDRLENNTKKILGTRKH
jgi:predicted GIY-YIG superfamily endonuclease